MNYPIENEKIPRLINILINSEMFFVDEQSERIQIGGFDRVVRSCRIVIATRTQSDSTLPDRPETLKFIHLGKQYRSRLVIKHEKLLNNPADSKSSKLIHATICWRAGRTCLGFQALKFNKSVSENN